MKTNNVSIILYFRNQRELAEQTLTAVYENLTGPFEVCVIDDASADGTADALRSVIEYYSHEETYFFEHAAVQGRALSIQEVIPQCSAPVIWMPAGFTSLNNDALGVALQQLRSSDAHFAVSGSFDWPASDDKYFDLAPGEIRPDSPSLPDDNQILIKLRGMDARLWFVNPYLDGWFALEWLFRLLWQPANTPEDNSGTVFIEVSPFTHPIDEKRKDAARKATLEFKALLRRYGLLNDDVARRVITEGTIAPEESSSDLQNTTDLKPSSIISKKSGNDTSATPQPIADISRYTAAFIEYVDDENPSGPSEVAVDKKDDIVANATQPIQPASASAENQRVSTAAAKTHVLQPFGKRTGNTIDAGDSAVADALKPRLEELFAEGEFPIALKEISVSIESNPGDIDLVRIKIIILERMRRYVEAAELKHKLKNGLTDFKIRKEKILVVDPADDQSGRAALIDDDQDRFPSRPIAKNDGKEPTSKSLTRAASETDTLSNSDHEEGSAAAIETKSAASPDDEDVRTPSGTSSAQTETDSDAKASVPGEDSSTDETLPADEAAAFDEGDAADTTQDARASDITDTTPSADKTAPHNDTQENNTDLSQTIAFKSKPVTVTDPSETRISVVVPTTGDGKRLLEAAFIALSRHSVLPDRELIVVDNASLDETYRYLNQLRKDRFMNIRVITNPENKGFAAAINQGIDVARGEYVFVMHNDVHVNSDAPGQLADLMDIFDDIDVMGPVAGVSLNPEQRMHQPESDAESLRYADYVDSFAMLIRRNAGVRFDERFEAAYFEDVDFCQQIRNRGRKVAIARGIGVDHRGGATSAVLGIEPNGPQFWKNLAQFNEKWQSAPKIPYFGEEASPIFQLITISETINPFYPEKEMVQLAQRLLTSETRHEIVQSRHARSDLYALIRLMMVLDLRDVLRQLEQQLDDLDLDDQLRHELIDFYYRKHIYSRGEKYLNELPDSRKHFEFRLLQLRILMGDKKLEEAAVLLNRLIEERPAHPELFKITADLHKLSGNRDEAAKFYLLAHQANPFVYSPRRDLLTS
ncbi:MAG: glycosyltransferase [Balneolales bacterium]|nr:glycosyltransferase [Balneolales bacterium]